MQFIKLTLAVLVGMILHLLLDSSCEGEDVRDKACHFISDYGQIIVHDAHLRAY